MITREERLKTLSEDIVYVGVKPEQVQEDLKRLREREGDQFGDELAELCRKRWRELGL